MESALAGNTLEIAIIGGLIAIIVAFITIGSIAVFRLGSKVDRLAEKLAETDASLTEKINQSHNELVAKINQSHNELVARMERMRQDLIRQMEQMQVEIVAALVNHSHPGDGEPPVFTAPPPVAPTDPTAREPEPTPADN